MNTNYTQWYNENEGRAYPISETASRLSDSGTLLPDDIIADLGLMIDPAYTDVRVSSVRVTSKFVTVGISSSTTGLLVGTYLRSELQPYTAYALIGIVDNVSGWIVFGTHRATGTEDYRFATPAQSLIEARVIRNVSPIPVKAFVKDGGNQLVKLSGIVSLKAGGGITITQDPDDKQRILVNLTEDMIHNILGPCNQPADRKNCKYAPFRTINGVSPDVNGKITLRFE